MLENIKQTAWLLSDDKVRHPYGVLKGEIMNDREVIEINIELHTFVKQISMLGLQICRVEKSLKHLTEMVEFISEVVVEKRELNIINKVPEKFNVCDFIAVPVPSILGDKQQEIYDVDMAVDKLKEIFKELQEEEIING